MDIAGARILLTGANGGIGSALAGELAARNARLALLGRDVAEVDVVCQRVSDANADAEVVGFAADLLDGADRRAAFAAAEAAMGGIDILVNCAGMMSFRPFAEEDPARLEHLVQLNLAVPMLLAREALPGMLARGGGRIVNIGSTFGTIGFAWFAAYSASKFGLRGLSEALRRELDGTGVGVTYVAPRAVRTPFNTDAVYRMAEATGMHMDDPEWVARRVVKAITQDAHEVYLGFPERFFARLNSFLPRLVDNGLRKQNRVMAGFARSA